MPDDQQQQESMAREAGAVPGGQERAGFQKHKVRMDVDSKGMEKLVAQFGKFSGHLEKVTSQFKKMAEDY